VTLNVNRYKLLCEFPTGNVSPVCRKYHRMLLAAFGAEVLWNMLWDKFRDDWLTTAQAARLFLLAALLVLALTAVLLGSINTTRMSLWARLPVGVLGVLGPIALFFLWFGMWRYWVRIDNSRRWAKRMWFLVLLVGFWWGSCLYCFFVYLPQTYKSASIKT
jgi:hypothetical protein